MSLLIKKGAMQIDGQDVDIITGNSEEIIKESVKNTVYTKVESDAKYAEKSKINIQDEKIKVISDSTEEIRSDVSVQTTRIDQLQAASTTLDGKIDAVNNRIQELSISDWTSLTTVDPNTLYIVDDGGVSTASMPMMAAYSPADFEDGGVAEVAYADTPLDEDMPVIEGEPTEDGE